LRVLSLAFGGKAKTVKAVLGDRALPAVLKTGSGRVSIEFKQEVLLEAGQRFAAVVS